MAPARLASLGLALRLLSRAGADDGEYGCGVAVGPDWPNCGQPGPAYNYDLAALMHSAAQLAGRPVWHYDWDSTQGGTSGDWTYVAMDWCPTKPQRPDPRGPSPGLLGWNEPDNQGQCNHNFVDVAEFVALARQFKALGKFVVSPAPTVGGRGWLDGFLRTMHDSTDPATHFTGVDYLAYHHYVRCNPGDVSGFPATTEADIFQELESVFFMYKELMDSWNGQGLNIKGLWLTEVSCGVVNGQWTGNCGAPCVQNTMRALIALVQSHSELKTWSWFSYNNFGNLWEDDRSRGYPLTDIGQWYFGNCNRKVAKVGNESDVVVV